MAKAKKKPNKTDDDVQREFWKTNGGRINMLNDGPWAEMTEEKLLPLLRKLRKKSVVISWGPELPGSKISTARMMLIDGEPIVKFERWNEDGSLDSVHKALLALSFAEAITYEYVIDEWPNL